MELREDVVRTLGHWSPSGDDIGPQPGLQIK